MPTSSGGNAVGAMYQESARWTGNPGVGDHTMSNDTAAQGNIFVCCVCGKVSANRYGFIGDNGKYISVASPDWDESCSTWAREFPLDQLEWNETHTRVTRIKDTVHEIK